MENSNGVNRSVLFESYFYNNEALGVGIGPDGPLDMTKGDHDSQSTWCMLNITPAEDDEEVYLG